MLFRYSSLDITTKATVFMQYSLPRSTKYSIFKSFGSINTDVGNGTSCFASKLVISVFINASAISLST